MPFIFKQVCELPTVPEGPVLEAIRTVLLARQAEFEAMRAQGVPQSVIDDIEWQEAPDYEADEEEDA